MDQKTRTALGQGVSGALVHTGRNDRQVTVVAFVVIVCAQAGARLSGAHGGDWALRNASVISRSKSAQRLNTPRVTARARMRVHVMARLGHTGVREAQSMTSPAGRR